MEAVSAGRVGVIHGAGHIRSEHAFLGIRTRQHKTLLPWVGRMLHDFADILKSADGTAVKDNLAGSCVVKHYDRFIAFVDRIFLPSERGKPEPFARSHVDAAWQQSDRRRLPLPTEFSHPQPPAVDKVVAGVANREEELNAQIQKFSIGWDVSRISRLTRCIMQLAIYEILYVEDVPTGVAISEAVRIAKMYDGDDTGSFVNGILGAYLREKNAPAQTAEEV